MTQRTYQKFNNNKNDLKDLMYEILDQKFSKKEQKNSSIFAWLATIVSGLFIVIVSTGFFTGIDKINSNNDRILVLNAQIKELQKSDDHVSLLITKLVDTIQNLTLNLKEFTSIPKFSSEDNKKSLDDFKNNIIQPQLDMIKSDIQNLKNKQYERTEKLFKINLLDEKIKKIELELGKINANK